jgi:hypothetical protein
MGLACIFCEEGVYKYTSAFTSFVLDICQNNLSITDMKKEDIGRSHVIGKPKDGKSQVIVRFISYRVRASYLSVLQLFYPDH